MTILTIPQKMSNTGSIHDIASDQYDRDIRFRSGEIFALVIAAYYGGKGYSTYKSEAAAVRASRKCEFSHQVIDPHGQVYNVDSYRLVPTGCLAQWQ